MGQSFIKDFHSSARERLVISLASRHLLARKVSPNTQAPPPTTREIPMYVLEGKFVPKIVVPPHATEVRMQTVNNLKIQIFHIKMQRVFVLAI